MRLFLLLCLGACLATAAAAAPIGPVRPQKHAWAVDLYGSDGERDMRSQNQLFRADRARAEQSYLMGRLGFGLTEKIELRAGLGAADLDVIDLADAVTPAETSFRGATSFAATAGFGTIFGELGRWDWAFQMDYYWHVDHGGEWPGVATTHNSVGFQEWHAAVGAQFRSERFRPYLGAAYSEARIEYDRIGNVAGPGRDESRRNFGPYIGTEIIFDKRWSAYGEARFVDETAFGGGLRVQFGK